MSWNNEDDKFYRHKGNDLFKQQKYEEAIECYTRAINANPTVAIYYTNRALCNFRMKRNESVYQDCYKAIELDPSSIKARVYLGMALIEMNLYDEAYKCLQGAWNLAIEQKTFHGDEIATLVRKARRLRFAVKEEKRIRQEIALEAYLLAKINEDRAAIEQKYPEGPDRDESMRILETHRSEIESLFQRNDERRRKREVPEYLCGKISFEIMQDPVITPSGITYDRKSIEEHLQRIGHFDPLTRQPLTQNQLVPNYVMKEVIDNFLSDNEWALDY